jgi:hypothetical protein
VFTGHSGWNIEGGSFFQSFRSKKMIDAIDETLPKKSYRGPFLNDLAVTLAK